jgi:small-conductance mechanosensitive channel
MEASMDANEMMIVSLFKEHSGEMLIFGIIVLVMITLLVILPQLVRANMRKAEMSHEQRLKSLEKGLPLPLDDDRARLAGRMALLVPIIVMISAATVTSFLVVYKSEHLFSVALAVWVVAGVVSMAAVTGGVALIGRLALIQAGEEEEPEDEMRETSYMN